jgi:hypothetical protein
MGKQVLHLPVLEPRSSLNEPLVQGVLLRKLDRGVIHLIIVELHRLSLEMDAACLHLLGAVVRVELSLRLSAVLGGKEVLADQHLDPVQVVPTINDRLAGNVKRQLLHLNPNLHPKVVVPTIHPNVNPLPPLRTDHPVNPDQRRRNHPRRT